MSPIRNGRRLLYVSYLFPPSGGVGSPRAANFAKYLPRHLSHLVALTARKPATPLHDYALLAKIPAEVEVCRAINPEVPYKLRDFFWKKLSPPRVRQLGRPDAPSALSTLVRPVKWALREVIQRTLCPDTMITWTPFAIRRARRIVREQRIDTVLLNTPPYSSIYIGLALKREFPDIRLITEMRDDWLGYYLVHFDSSTSGYKLRLAKRLEREIIEASDYIAAVTPAQQQSIRSRYPEQPGSKFLCISNGYDPDQFPARRTPPPRRERMVVTYLGSVYANPVYTPKTYLDAVESLPPEIRDRIETRFIGRIAREAAAVFDQYRQNINRIGFLPQDQAVAGLQDADCLLAIVDDPTSHAGKLFDYLASGVPILALTPSGGEIARILERTRTGWPVDAKDPAAIRALILDTFERWEAGRLAIEPDREAIYAYSWPALVERLARETDVAYPLGKQPNAGQIA